MTWKLWTPKICSWGRILSLHYIFCPGVTVKDSDYQKGNPVWEEQHNHFLYLCNRNNLNQRTLKSRLFSGFLWFSFTWFAFQCHMISSCFGSCILVLGLSGQTVRLLCFVTICGVFIRSFSFVRNFLAWCERKIFPRLNVTFDTVSSTSSFVIHWYYKGFFDSCRSLSWLNYNSGAKFAK